MAYYPATPFVSQFTTDVGVPASGWTLSAFVHDSATPTNMFIDDAGTSAGAVITLNARGEPQVSGNPVVIWLSDAVSYKFILKDLFGVTKWTGNDITNPGAAIRVDLANTTDTAKGAALVGYTDPVAAAYLKTVSDIINGEEVSVLRFIAPAKHAAIFASTNTDNLTADINTGLAAVGTYGRGALKFTGGTFNVTQLLVPGATKVSGMGVKTMVQPYSASTSLFKITGDNSFISDLQVKQNSTFGAIGIELAASFCDVANIYSANLPIGIKNTSGQAQSITRPIIIGSDFGIFSGDDFRNSTINRPHIQGGTGVWIQKSATQCEGLMINTPTILPSVTADANSGHGIVLASSCLEIQIIGGIIDNIDKYGLYIVGAAGGGNYEHIKVIGTWFGCDGAVTGSRGIYATGGARFVTLQDITVTGAQSTGAEFNKLSVAAPNNIKILGGSFFGNARDLAFTECVQSQVTGATLASAVSIVEDAATSIVYRDNNITNAPASPSALSKYRDNIGYVTNNSGATGISDGGTIAHGLSVTPTSALATATIAGEFASVTALGATTITVAIKKHDGTAGTAQSISWEVSK